MSTRPVECRSQGTEGHGRVGHSNTVGSTSIEGSVLGVMPSGMSSYRPIVSADVPAHERIRIYVLSHEHSLCARCAIA